MVARVIDGGDLATFADTGDRSFVTVAQAAARLGVTEPRLRRAVTRTGTPTQTQTRRTRTGTRTGTVLPEACLDALAAFFSENGTEREPDAEGERKRQRNGSQADAEPFAASTDAALVAHLTGEVEYLRAALSQSQANASALTAELSEARKQSAVLIAATAGAFDTLRIAPRSPESDAAGESVEVPAPAGSRPWWRFGK